MLIPLREADVTAPETILVAVTVEGYDILIMDPLVTDKEEVIDISAAPIVPTKVLSASSSKLLAVPCIAAYVEEDSW